MHDETEKPEEDDSAAQQAEEGEGKRSKAAAEAAALAEEFLEQLSRGDAGLGEAEDAEGEDDAEDAGEVELPVSESLTDAAGAGSETKAERRARTLEMVAKLEKRALEAEMRVDELTKDIDGHYQARLRLQADFENHRKRVAREREEQAKYANEDLLKEILPTLDNLERAIQHAVGDGESGPFVDGVKITLNQFLHILSKFGVTPFESLGEPFDPQLHDAMSQIATDEMEPNHVADQFVKGYHYHDRLLRPAMVAVSMAAEGAPATEEGSDDGRDDAAQDVAAQGDEAAEGAAATPSGSSAGGLIDLETEATGTDDGSTTADLDAPATEVVTETVPEEVEEATADEKARGVDE